VREEVARGARRVEEDEEVVEAEGAGVSDGIQGLPSASANSCTIDHGSARVCVYVRECSRVYLVTIHGSSVSIILFYQIITLPFLALTFKELPTLLIPTFQHSLHLRFGPFVHGEGTNERQVNSERTMSS